MFLLSMRRSKTSPMEAEENQRKLFKWTKVAPPTRVTLFRKQGACSYRHGVPCQPRRVENFPYKQLRLNVI